MQSTCSQLEKAIQYIQKNPPMQQMIVQEKIQWLEANRHEHSAIDLFNHVRRVRNNLFHGGKSGGSYLEPIEPQNERQSDLINSALIILEESKCLIVEVLKAYEG